MEQARRLLVPAFFAIFGLVLAHHEMILTGFAFTQNDLGDTRFNHYLLEHGYRWLFRWPGHSELFSPAFFYPAKNVGAYSDILLGAGPFYWPWRLVGFEPDTAFQLWICTVSLLNFVGAYVLLRRALRFEVLASSIGAALFAYAAVRINQTMHFQLFPQVWSLVCVYALFKLFEDPAQPERRRIGWLWLAAAGAVLQLWAGFYLGWFLALGLFIALALALAFPEGRRRLARLARAHPYTLALVGVTSLCALAPMATRYLEVSAEVGVRPFQEALTMIPSPRAWLHLGHASWLYGGLAKLELFRGIPMEHEQRVGFGFLSTAACLAGFWLGRRRADVRLFALAGLVLWCVSTLFGELALWKLIYEGFPGAKAIRAVSRIGIFMLLPVSVGVAMFVSWLEQRAPRHVFTPVSVLVCAFMLLEQGETTPAFDKHKNRVDVAQIASRIDPSCDAFLFSPVQGYGPYWKYQLDAMWAQLATGVPTLNGYSGNNPRGWPLGDTNLHSPYDEQRVNAALSHWISARGVGDKKICWVKEALQEGPYQAELRGQEVPERMIAGQAYTVSVTLKNAGTVAWRRDQLFRLGSQAPRDNVVWGNNRIELPSPVVRPGEEARFVFEVRAPTQPGVHVFQWRMVRDGVRWFGALTPAVSVRVEPPAM